MSQPKTTSVKVITLALCLSMKSRYSVKIYSASSWAPEATHKKTSDLWKLMNGILYVVTAGCSGKIFPIYLSHQYADFTSIYMNMVPIRKSLVLAAVFTLSKVLGRAY